MIKDIAHIALNPLDMDKTVAFFDNVFGWKKVFELQKENGDPWDDQSAYLLQFRFGCKGTHFKSATRFSEPI